MGEKLILPEQMTTKQAIETLQRFEAAQEEMVSIVRVYDAFPWDGAHALNAVLTDKYGWANLEGFMSTMLPVEVGYKKTVQVPWGNFGLPGINGQLSTGVTQKRGKMVFQLVASVKRKFEGEIQTLFDQISVYLDEHSIYRGQAIEIDFDATNDAGLVEPKFMNIDVDPASLVLNDNVREDVENVIFTPITRYEELAHHNIPFRSMVVLAGPYGTGKTLTTTVAAHLAKKHGVFFLKIKRAAQLAQGIEFCRQYEGLYGAVLQVEDVDRVTSGERDAEMDDILNTIDGVDSKNSKVFVLATTNQVETIHPAMLRNGRVRKVIFFTCPDAQAVQQLIRNYGKGVVAQDADLTEAGHILAGTKPATIADVISLSKLAMLKRIPVGQRKLLVDGEAIASAARTMAEQLRLVDRVDAKPVLPTIDAAIKGLLAGTVSKSAVDGDTLVVKKQQVKFKTNGASHITFE